MSDDGWGRANETGGEFVQPRQLGNHLVIAYPIGYIPHLQTKFTVPGKRSDAICVDIVDLDDKDEAGNPGKVYRSCNWMQAQIIQSLKPMIGSRILGIIGQGVSKNGMNPPWTITDALDNPAAKERAGAWIAAHPEFRPSAFMPREEFTAAAPQQLPPGLQQYAQPQQGYQQPLPQQQFDQGYQQPAQQPPPQYQAYNQHPPQGSYAQAGQQQPQYHGVQGTAPVSQEEMTMLQQRRQQTLEAQRQQQQNPGFQDTPPF